MKRLLLVCCLFAATASFAQTTSPVTKADYSAKMSAWTTAMSAHNLDLARTKWNDVHKLMLDEFAIIKVKYRDAEQSHNPVELEHVKTVMQQQEAVYRDIIRLKQDMVANKAPLTTKMNEFGSAIL